MVNEFVFAAVNVTALYGKRGKVALQHNIIVGSVSVSLDILFNRMQGFN